LQKLKSELTGNFESAVVTFLMQPAERDATLLRKAMDGTGTDEQVSNHVLTMTLLLNLFQRALLFGCQPASHCTFRRGLVRVSRLIPQPSGDASTAV
jgi:hypothetical protein